MDHKDNINKLLEKISIEVYEFIKEQQPFFPR